MDLRQQAILVQLNVGTWSGRKQDKKASRKIENEAGAKTGVTNVTKALIDREALINNKFAEVRTYFYEQTRPWLKGIGILKNTAYDEFMKGITKLKTEAEQAVESFVQIYPELRERAKISLGKMFNDTDYPLPSQIKEKFYVKIRFMPIPNNDFRVAGLSKEDNEEIKRNIEQSIKDGIAESLKQTYLELGTYVSRMIERLDKFGEKKNGNKRTKTFRDSLVENLESMVERLPNLNINDDPELFAIGKEIKDKLCQASANDLRDNKKLRVHVKEKAAEVLKKIEGYY